MTLAERLHALAGQVRRYEATRPGGPVLREVREHIVELERLVATLRMARR